VARGGFYKPFKTIKVGRPLLNIYMRASNHMRKDTTSMMWLPNTNKRWGSMTHSYNFMTTSMGKAIADTAQEALDGILQSAPMRTQHFLGSGFTTVPNWSGPRNAQGRGGEGKQAGPWRRIDRRRPYGFSTEFVKTGVRVCLSYREYQLQIKDPLTAAIRDKLNNDGWRAKMIRDHFGGP